MSDALSSMFSDYSDSAYDDLIKESEIDTRVGEGNAIVTKVTDDTWPSGDPRRKIMFSLLFAGNAKADLTVSPLPSPEVIKAEKGSWDSGKKRAIAQQVSIFRQFAQHYQTSPMNVREGDEFRVKTIKTKKNADGSGAFVRVIAVLSKDAANGTAPTSGGPGF